MTIYHRRAFLVPGATLLLLLGGCGNAVSDLKVGDWQEVGLRQPPEPRLRGSAVLTPIILGTGPIVQPGDLVKIKIVVFRGAVPMVRNQDREWVENTAKPTKLSEVPAAWIWVGKERGKRDYDNLGSWGNLGSARFRRLLIGRTLGDRFKFEASADAEGFMDIPLHGFSIVTGGPHSLGGQQWPSLKIAERGHKFKNRPGKGATFAEVEILDVCHGRLYQRTAEMTQWGIVPNWTRSAAKARCAGARSRGNVHHRGRE